MNRSDQNKHRTDDTDSKIKYYYGAPGHEGYRMPLWFIKSRNVIYYVLGIIEVLIAFRFVFKLLGANPQNGFVAFLYSMAGIFTAPFSGIFDSFVTSGLAAKSVMEPSAIIAMAVYAVLAWSLIGLLRLIAHKEGF